MRRHEVQGEEKRLFRVVSKGSSHTVEFRRKRRRVKLLLKGEILSSRHEKSLDRS